MIHFNVPPFVGTEFKYMHEAVENHKICGDGPFTKKCDEWLENRFKAERVMLTTSGSTALDMAALLCGIKPGDEVILPSFTFSSTANSFVLAGATLVFVDIRPDTMNIDETKIEAAITEKTKVICPVHYAGVACEMDAIMDIAKRHQLMVVEDAAQGVMSTYKGKALGTIGDFGCYSFHETKNYSMGEGGAIVINNESYIEKGLLEHPETDGIFASSDLIAAQVLQRLYAMGKRVPEDIKVVGFDDTVIAGITTPSITTIHQPIEEMSELSIAYIDRRRKGEMVPNVTTMPVSLVVRGSA